MAQRIAEVRIQVLLEHVMNLVGHDVKVKAFHFIAVCGARIPRT